MLTSGTGGAAEGLECPMRSWWGQSWGWEGLLALAGWSVHSHWRALEAIGTPLQTHCGGSRRKRLVRGVREGVKEGVTEEDTLG